MSDVYYPLAARALATFGERRQLLALVEELAEAGAAVSRLLNEKGDRREVVAEIVDVESVVASLRDVLAEPGEWGLMRQGKRAKLARVLASGDARTRPVENGSDSGGGA